METKEEITVKEMPLEEKNLIEKESPENEYRQNKRSVKKKFVVCLSLCLIAEVGVASFFFYTLVKEKIYQRVVRQYRYERDEKLKIETGIYTGNLDFGFFDGKGEFIFDTGSVYKGEWKNNTFNGIGELKIPLEGIYEGAFFEGEKSGHGVFTWNDGDVYDGEWKKDQMNGPGVYTTSDQIVYTGIFEKNKFKEGCCEFTNDVGDFSLKFEECKLADAQIQYKDGTTYSGMCSVSDITGAGTMIFVNEDKYVGELENNKRSGKGTYTWKSGAFYDGDWLADNMNGTGTYTYSPNNYATGVFEENVFMEGSYHLLNDFGEYTFTIKDGEPTSVNMILTNGTTYSGGMSEAKLNGNAQITYSNGDQYSGNVLNNQKSGQGVYTWKNGASYEGEWLNDKMHGRGKYHYPNSQSGYQLEGEFKNGRPNGECIYYETAYKYFKTDWSNGKCVKVYE